MTLRYYPWKLEPLTRTDEVKGCIWRLVRWVKRIIAIISWYQVVYKAGYAAGKADQNTPTSKKTATRASTKISAWERLNQISERFDSFEINIKPPQF